MPGELIPLPEMAASVDNALSPTQRVQLWVELMATCDDLLRAGLRNSTEDEKGLMDAYRMWYKVAMADHDRMIRRLADRLQRISANASESGTANTGSDLGGP
jgi:hypothetical protein